MDGMGTTVIISWEMSRFQIILDVTLCLGPQGNNLLKLNKHSSYNIEREGSNAIN